MNPNDPNVQLVEALVLRLGELKDKFVFVGGCATGLLITDFARPPVRATTDVDVLTEVTSLGQYHKLAEKLRKLGFQEDSNSDVICRWKIDGLQVDIMPTEDKVFGFTNRWYGDAASTSNPYQLPSGAQINLISPPYFIATKIEAFHGRGEQDYGASHDMEDIIAVIDGRPQIVEEIASTGGDLQSYLQDEINTLFLVQEFVDTINWHLPTDFASQSRVTTVVERLRTIAGL